MKDRYSVQVMRNGYWVDREVYYDDEVLAEKRVKYLTVSTCNPHRVWDREQGRECSQTLEVLHVADLAQVYCAVCGKKARCSPSCSGQIVCGDGHSVTVLSAERLYFGPAPETTPGMAARAAAGAAAQIISNGRREFL